MCRLVVTTSRNPTAELRAQAEQWARRLGTKSISRSDRRLAAIAADENVPGVLVIGATRPTYYQPASGLEYFFHPSMAKVRIHNLKTGRGDPMITAMSLTEGDQVLDCTLGRSADAIVASWVVGPRGKVVGIEKVPVIAQMAIAGLQNYEISPADVAKAMRRIKAYQADYNEYLANRPDKEFDIVYFDPIFDEPLERSLAIVPLRALADDEPVGVEAIQQALQVARRGVVIKQRVGTGLWDQLPFSVELISGTSSRIEYGVIKP